MLALATLLALAQQQPSDGSVEITLQDSITHKGIGAVRVTLVFLSPDSNYTTTTLFTDPEGRVVARNQPYGNYVLRIEKDGYRSAAPRPGVDGSSVTLSLGPGRPIYKLESELIPIATVAGRVLYSNGDPFPRARVSLLTVTYSSGRRGFAIASTEGSQPETDDRGGFRFSGVQPGEYYIRIENLNAEHLPRLSYFPGLTDSALATTVAIRGVDLSLDIRIPREPAYKISGIVVSPVPIRGGGLSLSSANPDAVDDPLLPAIVDTSSQNEFRFEIVGIPPGNYFLYPVIYTDNLPATNQMIVNVGNEDVENLRITMRTGVDLKGKVIISGDATTVRWESVRLSAQPRERLPGSLGAFTPGSRISQSGEFALPGLTPDIRFDVRVSGLPPDAYVSDIRQGQRSVYNEGFIRSNPSDSPIEIHVDTRGGTITGAVRDALNQPAKQVVVVVVPDAPLRANSLLYKRATTDGSGEFSVRGVAPGEYQLFAWTIAPPQGAEEDPRFLAPYEGRGTKTRVAREGRTEVKLQLLPR